MVLGANLFPIKPGQAQSIYDPGRTGLSSAPTSWKLIGSGSENEEIVKATLGIDVNEELKEPKNLPELEKFFVKRCHDSMQKYTYLRVIGLAAL